MPQKGQAGNQKKAAAAKKAKIVEDKTFGERREQNRAEQSRGAERSEGDRIGRDQARFSGGMGENGVVSFMDIGRRNRTCQFDRHRS